MKSYPIFISLLALLFIACKKERTCSCTVTTSGTITTHSQSAGITFSVNIGIPIPPIEITTARDTTYTQSYGYVNTSKENYEKISKRAMKRNCPRTYEESFQDGGITIIPGTSTVTTSESGKREYACKIE